MERRLIVRPPQPHRRAHKQREQADRREHVVHRRALRHRRQRDVERLLGAEPEKCVGEVCSRNAAVLVLNDVGRHLHGIAVDGNQHIAALDSRPCGRGAGGYLGRHDALRARRPEHAVFHFVPARAHDDVRDAKHDQHDYDDHRKRRPAPREQASFDAVETPRAGRGPPLNAGRSGV